MSQVWYGNWNWNEQKPILSFLHVLLLITLTFITVPIHFILKVFELKLPKELNWLDLDVPLNRYWTDFGCYLSFLGCVLYGNIHQFNVNHGTKEDFNATYLGVH